MPIRKSCRTQSGMRKQLRSTVWSVRWVVGERQRVRRKEVDLWARGCVPLQMSYRTSTRLKTKGKEGGRGHEEVKEKLSKTVVVAFHSFHLLTKNKTLCLTRNGSDWIVVKLLLSKKVACGEDIQEIWREERREGRLDAESVQTTGYVYQRIGKKWRVERKIKEGKRWDQKGRWGTEREWIKWTRVFGVFGQMKRLVESGKNEIENEKDGLLYEGGMHRIDRPWCGVGCTIGQKKVCWIELRGKKEEGRGAEGLNTTCTYCK